MRALLVLLPLLFLTVLAVLFVRNQRRALARMLEAQAANQRKQEFVLARLDDISKLIEDRTRSNAELQAAFDPLLAELMAMDTDGTLAPLVADTEKYFSEHLAKRSVGA
jgi:C4-dicarboxylate-specific signal transduction histidine kinase